ncbi:MAG: biopolymer transporter ExbD [Planctomycetota bacterium]|jgi:biopolymer transport protein ExbD|nr:biopolymer transporter ExbD [Planctomycetota bacterium]
MKFVPGRRTNPQIVNLTPLIDCMFLLVVFIMIAARFEPETGIPVDLPRAGAGESRQRVEALNITVTADGAVYLEKEEVAPENLERRLREARAAAGDPGGTDIILVVNGDKSASHGRVVEVLDAAARTGQLKVTIRTRP